MLGLRWWRTSINLVLSSYSWLSLHFAIVITWGLVQHEECSVWILIPFKPTLILWLAGSPNQDILASIMTDATKVDQSQLNQREFQRIFENICDSDFQSFRMFIKYFLCFFIPKLLKLMLGRLKIGMSRMLCWRVMKALHGSLYLRCWLGADWWIQKLQNRWR